MDVHMPPRSGVIAVDTFQNSPRARRRRVLDDGASHTTRSTAPHHAPLRMYVYVCVPHTTVVVAWRGIARAWRCMHQGRRRGCPKSREVPQPTFLDGSGPCPR